MDASDSLTAQLAEQLRNAYAGVPCPPIRSQLAEGDIDAAYAVQQINTQLWLQTRRLVGRKIGLTSATVQKQLGVDQPDFGMLFADMAYGDAEEIPIARLLQPRVEGEIAFVLGRDLAMDHPTSAEVMSAVDYAVAAIEVVDSRIAGWDISILDTIADNASSGAFVLGTDKAKLEDLDLRHCGMTLDHRGESVSAGAGAACLGNPVNAATWLAREMVRRGSPLRAGDVLMTGALGPMHGVGGPGVYELKVSGLGAVRAVFS